MEGLRILGFPDLEKRVEQIEKSEISRRGEKSGNCENIEISKSGEETGFYWRRIDSCKKSTRKKRGTPFGRKPSRVRDPLGFRREN